MRKPWLRELDNFPKELYLANGKWDLNIGLTGKPLLKFTSPWAVSYFLFGSPKPSTVPGTNEESTVCCIEVISLTAALRLVYPNILLKERL